MSRILVTGGAGFIGGVVARRLLDLGHEVIIYDQFINYVYPVDKTYLYHITHRMAYLNHTDRVSIIRGTTCDQDYLRRKLLECSPDRIIHLAAMPLANMAMEYPEEAMNSIFSGTMNLLQAARELRHPERFVYVSSSMVYGDFLQVPVREDHPLNPKDVYGTMKLAGELLTRTFGRLYRLDYTIVRPSAVYGPTDNNRRVLSLFLENALSGKPLVVYGSDEKLDFTYVTDAADGIIAATLASGASGETFNITRGRGRSILELAHIIAALIPDTQVKVEKAKEHMPSRGTLDISRAKELLDYDPKVDLEEGVANYLEFIKKRHRDIGT